MTERHQTAVANQQIQAGRKKGRDENLARQIDVEVAADQWKRDEHHKQCDGCRRFHGALHAPCVIRAVESRARAIARRRALRAWASPAALMWAAFRTILAGETRSRRSSAETGSHRRDRAAARTRTYK